MDGSKDKEYESDYIFTIRDPFDLKHNPGRMQAKEKHIFTREVRKACEALYGNVA